jgi:hypothetical protein
VTNSASGGGADVPPPDDTDAPPPDDDTPPPDDGPAACALCGRDVSDPEDRARLVDPAFCDRGGAAAQWKRGVRVREAVPRCPHKP